jgi:diguanylate cyclase (GGDEF)-like protein
MTPTVQHELIASMQHSTAGWLLFDPRDRLAAANGSGRAALGIGPDEHPTWEQMMRNCHQRRRGLMINTDDIDRWLVRVRRAYRRQPMRSFESDLTDGRWMWVTETTRPDGWVFVVLVDITPLKLNEATLRRARDDALIAAMTDPLTSLYNRRYIFRRLDDLLCTTQKMRIPLAVAMLDLDHFKRVNDVHGHAVGDGVLQHFAQQMRKHLRPLDAVGRIGGEEFLMLLPNADVTSALPVLERLRARLDDMQAPPPLPYTFSAGVAAALPGDGVADVVRRADDALYAAKTGGRNQLVVAACPA